MSLQQCALPIVTLLVLLQVGNAINVIKYVSDFYKIARPRDCQDLWDAGLREPGVYRILLNDTYKMKVYCAHSSDTTAVVIQHRSDSSISFIRSWQEYKAGFGDLAKDHWIGLEALHLMTALRRLKLDIIMEDWAHSIRIVTYDYFYVGDEMTNYKLSLGRAYGQLADDMAFLNNSQFATWDHPDIYSCAIHQRAGWWYNYCAYALLNGVYYYGGKYTPPATYYDGIYWKDWHGYDYSLKTVSMTIRSL